MSENDLKFLKTGFPTEWIYLNEKIAYLCEFFINVDDNQKPVDNLKKKHSSVI